jgi:hypothetical protein
MIYENKWSRWKPGKPGNKPTADQSVKPSKRPDSSGSDSDGESTDANAEEQTDTGIKNIPSNTDGQNPNDAEINDINEELIRDEELPDEPDGDDKDGGALINSDVNNGKYAKIKDQYICHYLIKDKKLFTSGKCVPVSEDDRKYPPHIIAAIKPKDNNWYFLNKEGKYCKRPAKVNKEVNALRKYWITFKAKIFIFNSALNGKIIKNCLDVKHFP